VENGYSRRRAAIGACSTAGREATWCQADALKSVEVPATVESRAVHTSRIQGLTLGRDRDEQNPSLRAKARRVSHPPDAQGVPGSTPSARAFSSLERLARKLAFRTLSSSWVRTAARAERRGAHQS